MTEGVVPEPAAYPQPGFFYRQLSWGVFGKASVGVAGRGGSLTLGSKTHSALSLLGVHASDLQDIIYGNLWVVPPALNLGFVYKTMSFDLYLWNSHFDQTLTLQDISYLRIDGVEVSFGTLPMNLLPLKEAQGVIQVSLQGKPILDGAVEFNTDLIKVQLTVTGSRVLPAKFVIHSQKTKISYFRQIVKAVTQKFQECRRELDDGIKRKLEFSLILTDPSLQGLTESLAGFGQDKVFGVAVVMERLTPVGAGNLQGYTSITVKEDLNQFFNAPRAEFVGVYNARTEEFEIGRVVSVDTSANTFNLEDPISGNFPADCSFVYPVVLCWLEESEIRFRSLNRADCWMLFREV